MPFIPVNLTAECEIRMLLDGQKVENTLYFKRTATMTTVDMTALGTSLINWWASFVADYTSQDVTLNEVFITNLSTATSAVVSVPTSSTITGSIVTGSLPNNVALAVSFRTANRGRSFRGRNYVVGLPETEVVKNTVSDGVVDNVEIAYNQLLSPLPGSSGWTWCVVSRFSGVDADGKPIPRTSGIATTITSALVVDPIVDSQRRRLPKRGQ